LLGFLGCIVGFRASTQPTLVSLGVLLGFLGSTQSTIIAMITIIRSRGLLDAKLKQTKKAKIDLEQAAILFRQQNNMAAYEQVMQILQILQQLGG
jgi:uncharacterized membrane protein